MKVSINPDISTLSRVFDLQRPVFVDCETNEADVIVGIGYTQDGINFYYSTVITVELCQLLAKVCLIGHNLKFDAKLLLKWGVSLTSESLVGDTALMSYSLYGSSRSHSLKALAKDLLGMEWSTYDQMTTVTEVHEKLKKFHTVTDANGKTKRVKLDGPEVIRTVKTTKTTLDKLPVDQVAAYCCSDVLATKRLYEYFLSSMDKDSLRIYQEIELPVMKVLFGMECRGISIDVNLLKSLDTKVNTRLEEILAECKHHCGDINIGSSKQLSPVLQAKGFRLPMTSKGNLSVRRAVLERYVGDPFIDLLLEHSVLRKLYTSFTQPLSALPTLPRVYATFNQITEEDTNRDGLEGISTGRLSCSNPNLQQIPIRSDIAKQVRELFIADENKVLIVADFSQIEPRILAHITKDRYLQDVLKTDQDLYTALIRNTPWEKKPDGRDIGKTFYLALSYGAQAKKLAKVFKCSVNEATRMLNQCWDNIPQVKEWQVRNVEVARKVGYVSTMYGRKRYLPEINSEDFYIRCSAERKANNSPIQGSAADIMKLTMIQLTAAGYRLHLVVHDEVLISVDPEEVDLALDDIKHIMENVVELDVPLKVSIHAGRNWNEAKGK